MAQNEIKLKLQNFRRLARVDNIVFQPGLTIISGPNGAGKTTLTEALLYALFGPSTKAGKKLADIRSDNTVGEVQVECELCIDQQPVRIVRKGERAELWVNNILIVQDIPSSKRTANKYIQRMLGGLSREQFEQVYVALQGETSGLVEETPKIRAEIIERVLQLDVLGQALKLQEEHRSEMKGNVQGQGMTICQDLQLDESARTMLAKFEAARKLQNRLEHAQKFLKKIDETIDGQRTEVAAAQKQLDAATSHVDILAKQAEEQSKVLEAQKKRCQELDELRTRYQGFAEQIAKQDGLCSAVQTDIEGLEEKLKSAEQYAEPAQIYKQLLVSISEKEQRLLRLPLLKTCYEALERAQKRHTEQEEKLSTFSSVDAELQKARNAEEETKRQRDALLQEDPLYKQDLETWQQQDAALKHMAEQHREALNLLQTNNDEARCPTCHQHFSEHTSEQRIQHLEAWLNNELPFLQTQLDTQKSQLDQRAEQRKRERQEADKIYLSSQKTLEKCNSALTQRDQARTDYRSAQTELERAQQEWDGLEETIAYNPLEERILKGEIEALQIQANPLSERATLYDRIPQFQQSLEEKREARKSHEEVRQQLQQQQAALGYQEETYQTEKQSLEDRQEELNGTKQEQSEAQVSLVQSRTTAQLAAQTLTWAIDHHDRFETSVQEFYKEERLYSFLEEFKKHFFETNTSEVFRRTTQLLQHAVTDQSILDIQFDGRDLSYLDASGTLYPINRLSGGEKSLVGLCLRIALAERAQTLMQTGKVSFLILDEVLSSLDDERCAMVQRIFEDVQQRGIFEHILMITHLDSVKQGWRAVGLEVRKKDTKTSEISPATPETIYIQQAEEIEV